MTSPVYNRKTAIISMRNINRLNWEKLKKQIKVILVGKF